MITSEFFRALYAHLAHLAHLEIIYDPAFTPEDVELVTSRYPTVKVNPIEEWGGAGSAILYLPHVPLWLLDHCLNMRKGALEHTLVISNNLHHIKETQSKSGKFTSETCRTGRNLFLNRVGRA